MQVFEWVIHTDQYVYFLRYVKQKIVRVLNKKIQDQSMSLDEFQQVELEWNLTGPIGNQSYSNYVNRVNRAQNAYKDAKDGQDS